MREGLEKVAYGVLIALLEPNEQVLFEFGEGNVVVVDQAKKAERGIGIVAIICQKFHGSLGHLRFNFEILSFVKLANPYEKLSERDLVDFRFEVQNDF